MKVQQSAIQKVLLYLLKKMQSQLNRALDFEDLKEHQFTTHSHSNTQRSIALCSQEHIVLKVQNTIYSGPIHFSLSLLFYS